MSLLTLVLPRLTKIVSLNSNLKLEFEEFSAGEVDEEKLLQVTEEIKEKLSGETRELTELIGMVHVDDDLDRNCSDLGNRINQQAKRISHGLTLPLNANEVSEGIESVNSNILLLEGILCSHYDEIAGNEERQRFIAECYKKAMAAIRKYPPPVFEDNFDEYENIIEGIDVKYSEDERARLSGRMLQTPGMVSFIMSLVKTEKRNQIMTLIREYDEGDNTAISPIPQEILSLLPCIGVIDFLSFQSEKELKKAFVTFFKDGNWLEAYVFLMLDRAGCSTRLLNAEILKSEISLEADVLALFRNRLFIFEAKDRSNSEGLTANDVTDITEQIEKIASLRSANIEIIYVICVGDAHQEGVRGKIEEISVQKGVSAKAIFLSNVQAIDDIVARIRTGLR